MGWYIAGRDLWFTYDGKTYAVHGVDIDVPPTQITAVMGPTGCGKTTLLMLLAGLFKPVKGCVYYNGKPLQSLLPSVRRCIGVLFQDPDDQLFNATVYDEIAFALRTLGMDEDEVRKRVLSIADTLFLTELLDRPPYRLSVGEKKRVALASILVYDPEILILDEPEANLDSHGVELVERIVARYRDMGRTVVIATHSLDLVLRVADRVYMMRSGTVEEVYRPHELLSRDLLERYRLRPPMLLELVEDLGIDMRSLLLKKLGRGR